MKRQPEGIPTGGQFAADRKGEPVGTLTADPVNVTWELGGDDYADVHTSRKGNTEVTITDDMRAEHAEVRSAWHFSDHGQVEINYSAPDVESGKRVAAAVMAENNADHGAPIAAGDKSPYGSVVAVDYWAPGMERVATDRLQKPLFKLSEQRNTMVPEHLRTKNGWYVNAAAPVLYGSAATDHGLARDLLPDFKESNPVDYSRLLNRRPELRADAPVEDR